MQKHRGKWKVAVRTMVLGVALQAPSVFAIPIVSIEPTTTAVTPGEIFVVDVAISGVTDLFGFQFDLGFNPTVLAAMSVSEGPFLSTGRATSFVPGFINNMDGSISLTLGTLLDDIPVTGSGILARIEFDAIAAGTSVLDLSGVLLSDPFAVRIVFEEVNDGMVTVVPEPATLMLLALGLAVLAARCRGRLVSRS